MKRRVASLITALALCLSLCPAWALAASEQDQKKNVLTENQTSDKSYTVQEDLVFNVNQYSLTVKNTSAITVQNTGRLHLMGIEGGTVASKKGSGSSGVQVQSGGFLRVEGPVTVTGLAYGLDIASGATVELAGGTFTGGTAAIQTADGDFAALLAADCAYFDASGNPMLPENVAAAKTVTVKQCAGHPNKAYTHTNGAPTHDWTCTVCKTKAEAEPCTFSFSPDGTAECVCGNSIAITANNLADWVYDSTIKPGNADVTVTLTGGSNKRLVKDTDYAVEYKPRADVGEITITVTGITYNGTFTKTYNITQAKPAITWAQTTKAVDYDGSPVEPTDLPDVTITAPNSETLRPALEYSYRIANSDAAFTPGLPTNAGTYTIKASLPESQNYHAAETDPCLTLTISKIPAVAAAPTANTLTYNREAQKLVTAGVLKPGAIAEGARIEFARAQYGPYSTDIPAETSAGNHTVWYRVQVEEAGNYTGTPATQVSGVRIELKTITPKVELSYYTTLYDGGEKQPTVTVKDQTDGDAVIPDSEYTVTFDNNRNVGTATVTVKNKTPGNYTISETKVTFKITLKNQDALTITNQPNTFTYGDKFTLSTTGGSGNGAVTWTITAGENTVATVDASSGQVTIKGVGTATVQAIKAGAPNYEDAIATWTFTSVKKPVTATVTADSKVYDGNTNATVHAVVEQGIVPGDEITITGLSGTFDNANTGTNKTVTVTGSPSISGNNSQYYAITYSSMTVKADITKATTSISVSPGPITPTLTYNGTAQELVTQGTANINTIPLEYALSENGPYSASIPTGTNAGSYQVWYRVPETDNYTGTTAKKVDVTIQRKSVTPDVTLTPGSFEYDGTAKEPGVTVKDGETVIPASEYTVEYSNNIAVGTDAAVTVTAKADGNYIFTATENFTITQKKAQVVTEPKPAGEPLTFNNLGQNLVTAGTASGGTMVYSVDNQSSFSGTIPARRDAKDYTVYYKVQGDDNHADSDVGSVTVTIGPKVVKDPTIKLSSVSYTYNNGSAHTPTVTVLDGSTVIASGEYEVVYYNNKDAGEATVYIHDKAGGNYTVTGSTTFVIDKADITDPAPTAATLTYNGKPQELLTVNAFNGGTILYSMSQNGTYTDAIPEKTDAGTYTVWYKVVGDKNHNDLAPKSVNNAAIKRKPLTSVIIELTPNAFDYDGEEHMPTVTVKDGNTVLPESEYTVTCSSEKPTDKGTYTITISDATDGNYDLSTVNPKTATFAIGQAPQAELVITDKPKTTNYGDTFTLSITGGDGNGDVAWSVTGSAATVNAATGEVKITDVGDVTITATKAESGNYFKAEAHWSFTAAPKPVTATVTVKSKPYDGGTSAEIETVTVPVLNNDNVTVDKASLTATFADANVGTGKKVTLDSSEAIVSGTDAAKYAVSYPDSVKADITQATTTITAPGTKGALTYTGQPQALVSAGTSNFGEVVYSLDNTNFSTAIPTGTNAGDYTVYYKVVGNANYTEAVGTAITVTIGLKEITPTVEASPSSYVYDGSKKTPVITVKDGTTVLDSDQYTVSWDDNLTSVGTHTVTVTSTNKNYTFTGNATATVEIVAATQDALKITGKPGAVYYGDIITLDTVGGTGNGSVKWTLSGGSGSTIGETTGVLEIKETGELTVTAKRTVENYGTVEDTWTFTVQPKRITPIVTAADKGYDGTKHATLSISWKPGDLVEGDTIAVTVTGGFVDANVGTNKQVTITVNSDATGNTENYVITYPSTTTASIYKVDAKIAVKPTGRTGLVANGTEHELLTSGGTTEGSIGEIEYSLDEKGEYSTVIPTAKDAGTYTVWYRVADSVNYTGIAPAFIEVTIGGGGIGGGDDTENPDKWFDDFFGDDSSTAASVSEKNPDGSTTTRTEDKETGTVTETTTRPDGSSVTKVEQKDGTTATVATDASGKTEATVALSAGAVSEAQEKGEAIILPIPEVNATKSAGTAPVVTVNTGSEGEVTVEIPTANATPGIVAVLLKPDGTEEVIRTSVPTGTGVAVSLPDGATVKIVDNSKDFADVPAEGQEADAVAFASARELFRGTGETTFAPDAPMTRAMMTTVLARLDGVDTTGGSTWYEKGQEWAVKNGISNGSNPNGSITREQLAVMLWRYAGSPAADGQALDFTDADKASGYAAEALRWATATGILTGTDDGRLDPGGTATRAQTAQILKKFIENI